MLMITLIKTLSKSARIMKYPSIFSAHLSPHPLSLQYTSSPHRRPTIDLDHFFFNCARQYSSCRAINSRRSSIHSTIKFENSRCTAAAVQGQHQQYSPLSSNTTSNSHRHGHIEVVIGPMFAGKTSELLRRVELYQHQGLCVAIVKSNKDDRYSSSHVVTHDGIQKPCYSVSTLSDFKASLPIDIYTSFDVIAIDEAQFFPDLKEFCTYAADKETKKIVLAGLDGDFLRQKFGQVLDLVPLADSVTKLTSICKFCEENKESEPDLVSPAVFSLRIAGEKQQEVVGGADKYVAVCRRHYVQYTAMNE